MVSKFINLTIKSKIIFAFLMINIAVAGIISVAAVLQVYSQSNFVLLVATIFVLALTTIIVIHIVSRVLAPLQKIVIDAQRASEAKSDFLTTMSHEIRTPMNAIMGIAQIQLQKTDLPTDEAAAFQKIYASGSTLLGLINDILDMSKIETGKLELAPVQYDTPSLINDTVQLNIVRIGTKPIRFILEVDENLPSLLYGDDLRIKQILSNLLSNAIKYTMRGHVKLSVSFCDCDDGDFVNLVFYVEDTGQGMKPEDITVLFDAYARFNMDTNRTIEGAGIGLTITDSLVEMMSGRIIVCSEYGKGSTFSVTIRQQIVDSTPIGKTLAKQLCDFSFTNNQVKVEVNYEHMPYGRVLIVDDVETNLNVAEGLLVPYKVSVETAISGFEALDKISSGKTYDIVFMDHMMPKMDGIETTRKLREMGYTGIIVALTANALVGNDEMFMSKGFDWFVSKPIDIRQLHTVMTRFVRDAHLGKAAEYKENVGSDLAASKVGIHPKIRKAFLRDAENAIIKIREALNSNDKKMLITNFHGMKSASANIHELEISRMAQWLENAAHVDDSLFIEANIERFFRNLVELMSCLRRQESAAEDNTRDIKDDRRFLAEQMVVIKNACENYDDDTAYAAIANLKQQVWTSQTHAAIEEIDDTLRLRSDFEKAAELAGSLRLSLDGLSLFKV